MSMLHTDDVNEILTLMNPGDDPVLECMEDQANREEFPTVGHEVGAFFRLCARLMDAESVFEFGSRFGYSAYWMAPAIGPAGRIVLTEVDEEELDQARTYFEQGGYADRAVFERGDALEIVDRYDGPFDLVHLDHENERYLAGFETVREKVSQGGMIVADNVLHSGDAMSPADLRAVLDGPHSPEEGSSLAGIAEYYTHVIDDPEFETSVVPVGEGIFVSVRTEA
ncbi:O-methyltransferase [Saliphagus sp. LR7]|uniref:O-methyltransferase n=1 Tax=Saliphagus sp. LR7 TaxID=2282654 RepID=UPI000DF7F398